MQTPESFPRQVARTRRFTLGAPRTITVTTRGTVLFCRSRSGDDPVNVVWELDPAVGREVVVIDPAALEVDESSLGVAERARRERARESASGVVGYDTDRAGHVVATVLGTTLVVARRDDTGTWAARALEVPSPGTPFDPRLDPTGRRIAVAVGGAVEVIGLDGSPTRAPLAPSEAEAGRVSWGVAEFVAAEEMGRQHGIWWDQAGERLLVTRVDESPVPVWHLGDPAEPSAAPVPLRYPHAGAANADVGLHLVAAATEAAPVRVEWDRAAFEYVADAGWDGDRPWVLVQSRDQRRVVLLDIDAGTGATTERHRVTDDAWVELVAGSPTFAAGRLVTAEDRDGSRRVCVDGQPITPEGLQVRAVIGAVGDDIWFSASEEPTAIGVWTVASQGAAPRAVSDGPGINGAVVEGDVAVLSSSTMARHGVEHVVTVAGRPVATLRSHAERPAVVATPQLLGRGTDDVRTAILTPAGDHAPVSLPVLMDPYGGPGAQRVLDTQTAMVTSQWFADQGFAVVVADGRGTPGRGPAWARAVHGDLAGPVLDDQVRALEAACHADARLDPSRVAIRGWSFGGYLAALAVMRRPEVFHAAVAGAPVAEWALYDTHYTERYLGHPAERPEAYEKSSLLGDAAALSRPLMLIHGLADDNVVVAHTLRLSRALLEAGRPHEVLPLSGVSHMTPQEVVAERLMDLQLEFLTRSLGRSAEGLASSALEEPEGRGGS